MGSLEKARSRFVDILRSAGVGTVWITSTQDPASVPSSELRELVGKTPEHDGQWLIDLGAKTQTDIPLPPRDGDRSPRA